MSERPGVVIYFEIEPALRMLDDSQRGKLFSAILEYAHYSVIPELTDPLLAMAWSFVQPSLDRDADRYAKSCQQKKIAGLKSDFRRNYAPKHGIDPDNEDALQTYISQRLSTPVDECRPTSTTTPAGTTTPTPAPTATSSPAENEKAAGRGAGEPLSPEEFDRLRKERIDQLLSITNPNNHNF